MSMSVIHRISGGHPDSLHFHVYDDQGIERFFKMVEVLQHDGIFEMIRGEEFVMLDGRLVGLRLWYSDSPQRPLPFYYEIRGMRNAPISV